jgi:hypothetical protein
VIRLDGRPLDYNARDTILISQFLAYGERSRRLTYLV